MLYIERFFTTIKYSYSIIVFLDFGWYFVFSLIFVLASALLGKIAKRVNSQFLIILLLISLIGELAKIPYSGMMSFLTLGALSWGKWYIGKLSILKVFLITMIFSSTMYLTNQFFPGYSNVYLFPVVFTDSNLQEILYVGNGKYLVENIDRYEGDSIPAYLIKENEGNAMWGDAFFVGTPILTGGLPVSTLVVISRLAVITIMFFSINKILPAKLKVQTLLFSMLLVLGAFLIIK
jgi:hypothetical protein